MKKALFIALLISVVLWLYAERRALVIGNSNYTESPLKNPVNDANAVDKVLRDIGFTTTLRFNLERRAFDECIDQFIASLGTQDEVVFYYSGHGAQIDGENYMIPVGKVLEGETDVRYEAVSANKATEKLGKAAFSVVVLDACRDNPFRGSRSGSKGLATMQLRSSSQYVIYSTASGQVANDGGSGNLSPFTQAFITHAPTSGITIEEMMRNVTRDVKQMSADRQVPFAYGSLDKAYYLASSAAVFEDLANSPYQPSQPAINVETLTGDLRITADFETDIWFNQERKGSVKPGYALVLKSLGVGRYVVEIFFNNCKYGYEVTVSEKQITNLNLRQNQLNTQNLMPLKITSELGACQLRIDGYRGLEFTTPFSILDPMRREYQLFVSREHFETDSLQVSSDPYKEVEKRIKLRALFASISITSEPVSGKVYLDGLYVGNTPLQLGESKNLKPGYYKMKVESPSPDYGNVEKDIQLAVDEKYQENVTLPFKGAYLSLKADYYPIAVYLNGQRNSALEAGNKIPIKGYDGTQPRQVSFTDQFGEQQLITGYQCHLRVEYIGDELPDFIPYSGILELKPNSGIVAEIELKPKYQALRFNSVQKGTKFIIQSLNRDKRTIKKGDFDLEVPVGDYQITISKVGFYSQVIPISVFADNGPIEKRFDLLPLPKTMTDSYRKWGRMELISLLGALVTVGFSGVLYQKADNAYANYLNADTAVDASVTRKKFLDSQSDFNSSLYLNIVPAAMYLYSGARRLIVSKRMGNESKAGLQP